MRDREATLFSRHEPGDSGNARICWLKRLPRPATRRIDYCQSGLKIANQDRKAGRDAIREFLRPIKTRRTVAHPLTRHQWVKYMHVPPGLTGP